LNCTPSIYFVIEVDELLSESRWAVIYYLIGHVTHCRGDCLGNFLRGLWVILIGGLGIFLKIRLNLKSLFRNLKNLYNHNKKKIMCGYEFFIYLKMARDLKSNCITLRDFLQKKNGEFKFLQSRARTFAWFWYKKQSRKCRQICYAS
jgi:hypothetical protein